MSTPSKILVIGSNSFSGASFVDFALRKDAEVAGLSRSKEANSVFLPYMWSDKKQNFSFHQLDLNNDLDGIIDLVQSWKPEYIVNFAAQSMVAQSWETPEDWFQTNAVSNVKLLNELRKIDFLKKYVHVTTPEVYGSTTGFINEDTPFNPSTPYAVSRAAADMTVKTFVDAYNFPAVSTRAANVYGPGQQLYRIIPRCIYCVLSGETLQLHGGGKSTRSFIHMEDVSDATWKIMLDGAMGETYHISTNEIVSIRSLVETICDIMDADFEKITQITDDRLGKDQSYQLNSDKVRKNLGWKDEISLEAGLAQTIEWAKSNFEKLVTQPQSYIHKK